MDEQWGYVGAKSRQRCCFTRIAPEEVAPTYSVNALGAGRLMAAVTFDVVMEGGAV